MNTRNLFTAAVVAALMITFCPAGRKAFAQVTVQEDELPPEKSSDQKSQDPVELQIDYGDGTVAHFPSHRGVLKLITVHSDSLMPLSLQFSADKIGMPVAFGYAHGQSIVSVSIQCAAE